MHSNSFYVFVSLCFDMLLAFFEFVYFPHVACWLSFFLIVCFLFCTCYVFVSVFLMLR